MNVLVVSGCSASKRYEDGVGTEALDQYPREELVDQEHDSDRILPARKMYTGNGHRHVADAVDHLRTTEGIDVDWQIISAGFGALDSELEIIPYDCTFSRTALNKPDYRARADRLDIENRGQTIDELVQEIGQVKRIPEDLLSLELTQYNAIFAMLGREYLLASAKLFEQAPASVDAYAIAPDSMDKLTGSFTRIPANEAEREALDARRIDQKEMQFQTFVSHIDTARHLEALLSDLRRIHELSTQTVERNKLTAQNS